MEIKVNVLGKVAFKATGSKSDIEKTEKRIEDLRKAVFYIQDEIKLLGHGTD